MGAVIGMDGLRADRKQLFDIGIAGPIAGLVVAVPIIIIGILKLDLTQGKTAEYALDIPLVMACIMSYAEVPGYEFGMNISQAQLNPYFMAGWVGLLVTGLNMLPISQLDGGHVTYTLFGKNAHWIARGLIVVAMLFVIIGGAYIWMMMLCLIMLMGIDHPPTSDDTVEINPFRRYLGYASLSIPLLCFPPYGIIQL
jgi:membrane-associated protease RseP (regulator of RpoE activity)